ncbi:hypothetical protein [Palleronia caenipelagi]|uniref:hypothetical protein n=1 Tax=Palleronia caenipelagi TaxID=2489174 RepID=UPI00163D50F5|nr:hypothetical protein [Palleronia caenipelagi]
MRKTSDKEIAFAAIVGVAAAAGSFFNDAISAGVVAATGSVFNDAVSAGDVAASVAIIFAAAGFAASVAIIYFSIKRGIYVSGDKNRIKIHSAPGAMAVKLLQFLLPRKAYDEIFAQVIADTRLAYYEALAKGNTAKARYIRIRDSIILAIVFVEFLLAACLDRGVKIYKAFSSR